MKSGDLKFGKRYQLIILVFISLVLNINTISHGYVLDDFVVLTENKFVERGIKGIPEILTNDLMTGVTSKKLLSQPRYRPFSLIVFAIEHQIFGTNHFVSHLINILLFGLLIVLLYTLLQKYIFRKQNEYLSFLVCLLFAVHPIHTEVIANVKSRDELLTFIFLVISVITFIKFFLNRKIWQLLISMFCFFIALLTRESAVTFIAVVPLIFYFFYDQSVKKSILQSIPLIIVFAGYMILRYSVIGFENPVVTDVMNAPFLFATAPEAFATKFFILLKYLFILVFPHPLSSDYSYNQIPYIELTSIYFLLSVIAWIVLVAYALVTFKSRSMLSFSILYFMVTISLVTNFVMDIGTPFSERLLFQPSLAFCIAFAFLVLKLKKKFKLISTLLLFVFLISFSIKTVARNETWKSNETLFLNDVNSAPNSGRTTWAAAEIYRIRADKETNVNLKAEDIQKALQYGEKSMEIYPGNVAAFVSLGLTYYAQLNYYKAAEFWNKGFELDSTCPEIKVCRDILSKDFYKQGNGLSDQGRMDDAITCYSKSIELNNLNVEAWYNLGGIYFLKNDSVKAYKAWEQVKKLDPNHRLNRDEFTIQ